MKKIWLLLLFANMTYIARAQEVTATDVNFKPKDHTFYTQKPDHFFPLRPGSTGVDFMKTSAYLNIANAIQASSHLYDNTALMMNKLNSYVIIRGMKMDSISKNGFTISFWFKDYSTHKPILSLEKTINGDAIFSINKLSEYFNIYKTLPSAPTIKIQAASFNFDQYASGSPYPATGDMPNGFRYFCLTSDANSVRIYVSSPDGKLYSEMYNFSLSNDARITGNSILKFTGDQDDNNCAIDDIMVYYKALTPNDVFNAFHLQSPLYSGISYQLRNTATKKVLTSSLPLNDTGEGSYLWSHDIHNAASALGPSRFTVSGSQYDQPQRLINIGNGLYGSDSIKGGNVISPTWSRDAYHKDYRQRRPPEKQWSLYTAGEDSFQVTFKPSYTDTDLYRIGIDLEDPKEILRLVSRGLTSKDHELQMAKASPIILGPEQKIDVRRETLGGHYVKFRNYNTSSAAETHPLKYMETVTVLFPTLYLRDASDAVNQRYFLYKESPRDKNFIIESYNKSLAFTAKKENVKAKAGIQPLNDELLKWELVYVKNDENNQPLYAIRTANAVGSLYLGAKEPTCPGLDREIISENCYITYSLSDVWDKTPKADPNKNHLWYIEYH